MSDAEFDPEPLLYLPTAVCQQLAESGAVPEGGAAPLRQFSIHWRDVCSPPFCQLLLLSLPHFDMFFSDTVSVAGEDREFDDKGAANWIKYAEMMRISNESKYFAIFLQLQCSAVCLFFLIWRRGEDPFNMTEAADYLESLAHNTFERFPPLPIDRCLLAPGPAVGPGLSGGFQDGVCLDADTFLAANSCVFDVFSVEL